MEVPAHLQIWQNDHWTINHRIDSALPGYLMLSPMQSANALHELSVEALAQLGPLLARMQSALTQLLEPTRFYISRYGHMPGYAIHFHIIPVAGWVEQLFWADARYRALQTFADASLEPGTDGAELTLFIWREFCERQPPLPAQGPSIADVVNALRKCFAGS